MALIIWLTKLQWNLTIDRLTYEKHWSIDRISNLLIGVANFILVIHSLLHHSFWLIPLGFINASVFISSMRGDGLLLHFLTRCGFKEREEILQHLKIQVRAQEQIKKKMNENDKYLSTSNFAKVFIFDSLESQTVNIDDEHFVIFDQTSS